jgi:uncharacterized protein
MTVEHHPLIREFPEHRDALHRLKITDAHFARLASEYEDVDKEIVRIEDSVESASDATLETLKKRRLLLKDRLYAQLTA